MNYFLVLLLFSFCLCEQYANPREKIFVNYSYIVLAAILIIFTAGRYEVGYDWVAYYDFFTKRDDISGFEPGYIFYNNLFPTYYTMQIITCIIGCVVLFKYISSLIRQRLAKKIPPDNQAESGSVFLLCLSLRGFFYGLRRLFGRFL